MGGGMKNTSSVDRALLALLGVPARASTQTQDSTAKASSMSVDEALTLIIPPIFHGTPLQGSHMRIVRQSTPIRLIDKNRRLALSTQSRFKRRASFGVTV